MPVQATCDSCGGRLKVPDNLVGRKVKCPRCGGPVTTGDTGIAAGPAPKRPEALTERPPERKRPIEVEPLPEPDEREEERRDEDRPRRKKRRRRKKRAGLSVPPWVWTVAGIAAFFMAAVAFLVIAALSGKSPQLIGYGIGFLIMLPVSVVILIVSMFISSAVAGGIEFGEVHVVVPKALALLVVVNLVSIIPYAGFWLSIPIWIVGLMMLFQLDIWEARVLFLINWGLGTVVRIFLMMALLSAGFHGGGGGQPQPKLTAEQAADLKVLQALGVRWETDVDQPGNPIVAIDLSKSQVKDADLVHLKRFNELQSLDLSGTAVTDAGLAHLEGLGELEEVNVSGTRVTAAGVARLKRALPQVSVIRGP
jgi:hypothetical protein